MKKNIYLFFLLSIQLLISQNSFLQSGPMVGYCEMKEALIWLQTKQTATAKIDYFAIDTPTEVYTSETLTSTQENGFTLHFILNKLQEGKKYNYTVYINNQKVILPYETSYSAKKLWQYREDAPNFTVAVGSCTYISETALDRPGKPYGSGYGIFESIAKKNPDIMLWGGDNIYLREADWDSKTGIYHRYTHSRAIKEMQPLLAKTQNFAIWDDHDYGPNDGDRGYYFKNTTQKAFRDFWGNKSYGMQAAQNEGVYSTFNWGDVQFFLLDNRFYKTPNDRLTDEKCILGKEQLNWLVDNLSTSKASFKIIVIGGQVLNSEAIFENYANYEAEKNQLLNEILANKIKGVLFISGDRHFTELAMLPRENAYPLYDWTVSPLTSGIASSNVMEEKNKHRVAGSVVVQNNFGTLSFTGTKENRQLKLTTFDAFGKELWSKIISKKELE